MLGSLLENAISRSPRGATIEVAMLTDQNSAIVKVKDKGADIAEDRLEHVFEALTTSAGEGEGRGLGLAIAREIAVAHGAVMKVESAQGQGATFYVKFPYEHSDADLQLTV